MKFLVGSTGFVGSNLAATGFFDRKFHSSDVHLAFGANPELLVYAGLRAEKYLANRAPSEDLAAVECAYHNIRQIAPHRLVLISSVDVYKTPIQVFEDSEILQEELQPYGANRYYLEQLVRKLFPDALIVRLPGLYGRGLKKNFVYDLIHRIPTVLMPERMEEFGTGANSALMKRCYELTPGGIYRLRQLAPKERCELRQYFEHCGFSAVQFTDSRSVQQFYPLRLLWSHIAAALGSGLTLLNLSVEPISVQELYRTCEGSEFANIFPSAPARYDMRSRYATLFGGSDGYIMDKDFILPDLCAFIRREREKLEEDIG